MEHHPPTSFFPFFSVYFFQARKFSGLPCLQYTWRPGYGSECLANYRMWLCKKPFIPGMRSITWSWPVTERTSRVRSLAVGESLSITNPLQEQELGSCEFVDIDATMTRLCFSAERSFLVAHRLSQLIRTANRGENNNDGLKANKQKQWQEN